MLICLLYAFSCNKTLNKSNNNHFGINCFLIFLKIVMSPIRMVVQQSALSSPKECVCVCVALNSNEKLNLERGQFRSLAVNRGLRFSAAL